MFTIVKTLRGVFEVVYSLLSGCLIMGVFFELHTKGLGLVGSLLIYTLVLWPVGFLVGLCFTLLEELCLKIIQIKMYVKEFCL